MSTVDYFSQLCPKVNESCDGLKKLGVDFFSYSRLGTKNDLIYLSDNSNYLENKLQNNHFDGYNQVKDMVKSGYNRLILTGDAFKRSSVLGNLHSSGFWNSLDLYRTQGDYLEVFHFGGGVDCLDLINYYINNPECFENFLFFFRQEFADILYKQPNSSLIMPTDLGGNIARKPEKNFDEFFKELIFKKIYVNVRGVFVTLSNREWQCIRSYANGFSAKEIGINLGISNRTAEGYILRAKQKLGAHFSRHNLRDLLCENAC